MTISNKQRWDVLHRDNYTCQYCGRKPPEATLEIDHVTPRKSGGTDDPTNLVVACRECNGSKSAQDIVPPHSSQWSSLIGKYFLTFRPDDGAINHQGIVLAAVDGEYYLVQLFEWLTGYPSYFGKFLVRRETMATERWAWFESASALDEAYRTRSGSEPDPAVEEDNKQRRSSTTRAALPKAQSTSTSSIEPAVPGCDSPPGLNGAGEASQSTRSHVAGWIAPTVAPTERTADILRVLQAAGAPCSMEAIAAEIGVHRTGLLAPMKALVASGAVVRSGTGGKADPVRYTLHNTKKETNNGIE